MQDDTQAILKELHVLVNNFSIQGEGVGGTLEEGYLIDPVTNPNGPMDVPEGPEGPEFPEQ